MTPLKKKRQTYAKGSLMEYTRLYLINLTYRVEETILIILM